MEWNKNHLKQKFCLCKNAKYITTVLHPSAVDLSKYGEVYHIGQRHQLVFYTESTNSKTKYVFIGPINTTAPLTSQNFEVDTLSPPSTSERDLISTAWSRPPSAKVSLTPATTWLITSACSKRSTFHQTIAFVHISLARCCPTASLTLIQSWPPTVDL